MTDEAILLLQSILFFAAGALVFGFITVGAIGIIRGTSRVKEDAAIGIVFTTLFTLGLVLISTTPVTLISITSPSATSSAFRPRTLQQIVWFAVIAFALLIAKRRDLTLYAFDPTHAYAIGLSPRTLGALLLARFA